MEIKNVVSNEILESRFNELRANNWKVSNLSKNFHGNIKEKIDNWPTPTRNKLLALLSIVENEAYKFVYHDVARINHPTVGKEPGE